jgi:glycosyltransferase involved in cell wall biosynthesis
MNRPRVAAIIPAYNEASTVAGVVSAAKASPLVDEVIVVSDGSTDATSALALAAGATVVETPGKSGKGGAMRSGLARTDAPVIVFLDADLRGLTPEHVERIVSPVLDGKLEMAVGLRDRGPILNRLVPHLPLIGGERAMRRRVIDGVDPAFLQGFMVESALNYQCRTNGWAYGGVPLPALTIRRKYEKVGWTRGVVEYAAMAGTVAKAMLSVRLARAMGRFPKAKRL